MTQHSRDASKESAFQNFCAHTAHDVFMNAEASVGLVEGLDMLGRTSKTVYHASISQYDTTISSVDMNFTWLNKHRQNHNEYCLVANFMYSRIYSWNVATSSGVGGGNLKATKSESFIQLHRQHHSPSATTLGSMYVISG